MRRPVSALSALVLLAAGCSEDSTGDSKTSETPAIVVAPVVAPYIDIVSGTVDVDAVVDATGQKDFTLAFVLADSAGSCTATWGGTKALDDSTVKDEIAKITAAGGEVVVSTGGASGTYLESVCPAGDLAEAYAAALDAAGSNYLDVDIEQTVTPGTVTQALSALQKDRGTAITLTVPVGGTVLGLTDASIALLESAKDTGMQVTVNAMTMNFSADGDWGDGMATATEAVIADVASVWSDYDDATINAMVGVTPMIGVNDTGPVTEKADAQTLLDFAREKGLGFVRFWSVNRDNGDCADGSVQSACSGIEQSEYQFTSLFSGYQP